ncbi:uncharacterized protein LOC117174836 [Belonocnema kinseyi]|uniref:uncharacterized protein LOC117174836 n=1 Tax=Belonocnema kinseyi TaxID=2817044 RepID=UPI00143D846E|nr:uncharacterized protein LOC117174836 [Belonocnema kinseyi]
MTILCTVICSHRKVEKCQKFLLMASWITVTLCFILMTMIITTDAKTSENFPITSTCSPKCDQNHTCKMRKGHCLHPIDPCMPTYRCVKNKKEKKRNFVCNYYKLCNQK